MPLLDSKAWFNWISNSLVTTKQTLSSVAKFCEWTDFFNYTVTWLNNHSRQSDFQSKQMDLWLNLLTLLGLLVSSQVPDYEHAESRVTNDNYRHSYEYSAVSVAFYCVCVKFIIDWWLYLNTSSLYSLHSLRETWNRQMSKICCPQVFISNAYDNTLVANAFSTCQVKV